MPQSLDEFLFIQAYYFAPEPISVKPSGGVARAIVAATVSPTSRPGYSMVLLLCGNSPGLFDQAKSDIYCTCRCCIACNTRDRSTICRSGSAYGAPPSATS